MNGPHSITQRWLGCLIRQLPLVSMRVSASLRCEKESWNSKVASRTWPNTCRNTGCQRACKECILIYFSFLDTLLAFLLWLDEVMHQTQMTIYWILELVPSSHSPKCCSFLLYTKQCIAPVLCMLRNCSELSPASCSLLNDKPKEIRNRLHMKSHSNLTAKLLVYSNGKYNK